MNSCKTPSQRYVALDSSSSKITLFSIPSKLISELAHVGLTAFGSSIVTFVSKSSFEEIFISPAIIIFAGGINATDKKNYRYRPHAILRKPTELKGLDQCLEEIEL